MKSPISDYGLSSLPQCPSKIHLRIEEFQKILRTSNVTKYNPGRTNATYFSDDFVYVQNRPTLGYIWRIQSRYKRNASVFAFVEFRKMAEKMYA